MNYNETYLNNLKIEKKKRTIILLITIGISIGILLFMFLTVKYEQEILIKVLSCVLLTCVGWVSICEILFNLIPLKRNIEHISLILRSNLEVVICQVIEIGKKSTISKEIKGYEIVCMIEDKKRRFYFNDSMGSITFKKYDHMRLAIKNNFVVGFEVIS